MKDKKRIKRIAETIVELEKKCTLTKEPDKLNKYMSDMKQLATSLSLEELLEVDEYIQKNNLLK